MIISNCDDLTGWYISYGTMAIDNVDFVEGTGSILWAVNAGAYSSILDFYVPYGEWKDLTAEPLLRIRLKPSLIDGSHFVTLGMITAPTAENPEGVTYSYGTLPLTTGVWNVIEIDLRNPVSGTPDLTLFRALSLRYTTAQDPVSQTCHVDHVETVTVEPMGYIEVHAYVDATAVEASGRILETGQTFSIPVEGVTLYLPVGTYTLEGTYQDQILTSPTLTVTEGVTTTHNFRFAAPPTYLLTVRSEPNIGANVTVDGVAYTTNFTIELSEGIHQVIAPEFYSYYGDWYFVSWEDGSTDPVRTIDLIADKTITATYVPPPQYTISGTVTDAAGFPLAGATVQADTIYSTTTLADGIYSLTVNAGVYTLTISLAGYKKVTIPNVDASVGDVFVDSILTAAPCFIATVAFGSPLAPQLDLFRAFRDKYLPPKIVKAYYWLSPPLAEWIKHHARTRKATRSILNCVAELLKRG